MPAIPRPTLGVGVGYMRQANYLPQPENRHYVQMSVSRQGSWHPVRRHNLATPRQP